MSGAGVAAAGAAVALYFYTRRRGGACAATDGEVQPVVRFRRQEQAPNTWIESLYYFAEAIRHIYGETLGTWRTADLLIGLAYLARRYPPGGSPLGDVAAAARPYGVGLSGQAKRDAQDELATLRHCMQFGLALRRLTPAGQLEVFRGQGFAEEDFLVVQQRSGLLKPAFFLLRDRAINAIVLLVRGTQTIKDMFTSMTSASKPHHVVDADGVTLGYTHFGILAAARWIRTQVVDDLREALATNPGMRLQLVGHSMGGGTAAILTMMLREMPEFRDVTCIAIACPAVMTLHLAQSCAGYVTTVINNTDLVPTMSLAGVDSLRQEVTQSAWAVDFRADVRSSAVVRAVEGSLSRVGGGLSSVALGTVAATSWTTARLSQGLRACSFGRRPRTKKRKSHDNLVDLEAWAAAEQASRLRRPAKTARGFRRQGSANGASSGGAFGALSACTGRRRKPVTAAEEAGADHSGIEDASQWIEDADKDDDERTWGSVLAAFQAWGGRAEPPLDAPPRGGVLSSVAAAPVAAASYLYQWVPSLGLGRARRSANGSSTPGRRPLPPVRLHPEASQPLTITARTGDLLSRLWLPRGCTAAEETFASGTPPAGCSPRATSPPLERATSAPEDAFAGSLSSHPSSALLSDEEEFASPVAHLSFLSAGGNSSNSSPVANLHDVGAISPSARSPEWYEPTDGLYGNSGGTFGSSPTRQQHSFRQQRSSDGLTEAPSPMCMVVDDDSGASDDEELPLPEEMHRAMAEMKAEVEAEEATERANSSCLGSLAGDSPPGSPGRHMHGIDDPPAADGLPDTARGADMRRTYPAGRILHLVPAFLVFPDSVPEAGSGDDPSTGGPGAADSGHSRNSGGGIEDRPEAAHNLQQTGSDGAALPLPPPSTGMAAAAGTATAAAGMAAEAAGEMPGQQVAAGPASSAGETADEAAEQGEPFVLLESVPHEVYGRMRLCRTMVRDHFTPSYLRNMRHAAAAFEDDYSNYGGGAAS